MIATVVFGIGIVLLAGWIVGPILRSKNRIPAIDTGEIVRLTESRNSVYRSMLDLEFDRSVGKVSSEDYAELMRQHESEAAEILREIDESSAHAVDPLEAEIAAARERLRK
jgi:hypothetical protein